MFKVILNGTNPQNGIFYNCLEPIIEGKAKEICIGFQVNRNTDFEALQRDFFLSNLLDIGNAVFVREKKYFLPHSFRELHQGSIYKDRELKAMNLARWEEYIPEPVSFESDVKPVETGLELRAILILEHKDDLHLDEELILQFHDKVRTATVAEIQKESSEESQNKDFGNSTKEWGDIGKTLLKLDEEMEMTPYKQDHKKGFFRILNSNDMIIAYGIIIEK